MKEEKEEKFENSRFSKLIRITEDDWIWIKRNKVKGGMAVLLENIIGEYRKNYDNSH